MERKRDNSNAQKNIYKTEMANAKLKNIPQFTG